MLNINTFLCPSTNNLYVKGNNFDDNHAYFKLYIDIWVGTDSKGNACKSTAEIQAAIAYGTILGINTNTYFDGNDYDNPIKTFLDDRIFDNPIYGFQKNYYAYIKQNSVELQDNLFSYSPDGSELSFNCM